MKKHTYVFLFLCALCYHGLVAQTNQLRVVNPDRIWQQAPAQIKDVILTVDPRGAFVEYGLYMSIEDIQSTSSFGDQLEAVLDFSLPAEASVIDSWLWVEGEIIQADLLDRWTASQIYEDIVDRRRDPSILFKESATQYHLRIFPLPRRSERRVKIAWLQPIQWGDKEAVIRLPDHLLGTSLTQPSMSLRVFSPPGWTNPRLASDHGLNFTVAYDESLGGSYYEIANMPAAAYGNNQLRLDAPFEEDILVTTSQEGGEQYYQMVYQPAIPPSYFPANRQLVLIDYQEGNSEVDRAQILQELRLSLQQNLRETDAFNLILPSFPFTPISEDWIPATDEQINAVFDGLSAADIPAVSNLPILLERAFEHLAAQPESANVVLITNSGSFSTLSAANALFDRIRPLFVAAGCRVSISYLITNPPPAFVANNRWYYGNEYLYELLARQTDGLFEMPNRHSNSVDLPGDLMQMLGIGPNIFGGFDLQTRASNGFCYNRHELLSSSITSNHPTFVEIGQFVGAPPFQASFLGVLNGQVFEVESEASAASVDRQAYRAYLAADIRAKESLPQTNSLISTIIDQSLAARVLCRYTAFLALEPAQGGVVCEDCADGASGGDFAGGGAIDSGGEEDDTGVVATQELQVNGKIELVASPNPVQHVATIRISTGAGLQHQTATCRVLDSTGKLLRTFAPLELHAEQEYTLEWDTNDLPRGLYLIQLLTEEGILTIKVLKQ